jgi:hypothetical protein
MYFLPARPLHPSYLTLTLYLSLSLLLWTAHPPAIGPVPRLSSLIPYWSAQSTGLLNNQRSFCTRLTHRPEDGGSTHLWNVGRHPTKNMAVHPRRFWASYLTPWELEIPQSEQLTPPTGPHWLAYSHKHWAWAGTRTSIGFPATGLYMYFCPCPHQ